MKIGFYEFLKHKTNKYKNTFFTYVLKGVIRLESVTYFLKKWTCLFKLQ